MGNDESSDMPGISGTSATVPLEVIPLHSTNLLTVLDADGIIQYESPSRERIFGFDQEEFVTEHVADYFHPDDREKVIDAFDRIVASEEYTVESVEYRHATADGAYLWVESVASANPTPNGHYVINTCDISDRKAREEELQQTNDQLDEIAIRGENLAMGSYSQGTWENNASAGKSASIEGVSAVSSGDSWEIDVGGDDYVLRVVWESTAGDTSSELAVDRGPGA